LQLRITEELESHVIDSIKDRNGNHVIQKCIQVLPAPHFAFIVDVVEANITDLSTHPFGCRVIQRVLEQAENLSSTKQVRDNSV
jgi:pumilio RNA-binding family